MRDVCLCGKIEGGGVCVCVCGCVGLGGGMGVWGGEGGREGRCKEVVWDGMAWDGMIKGNNKNKRDKSKSIYIYFCVRLDDGIEIFLFSWFLVHIEMKGDERRGKREHCFL